MHSSNQDDPQFRAHQARVEKWRAKLDQWQAKYDELGAKAQTAHAEMQRQLIEQRAVLGAKIQETRAKLDDYVNSGKSLSDQVTEKVDSAFDEVAAAWEAIKSKK